jgi:hypothetical protein
MKFEIVKRAVFEEENGPVSQYTRRAGRALELLEKMRKVPLDHLLLVPIEKGDDPVSERKRLYQSANLAQKQYKPNFKIRVTLSRDKRHVVIWKEALSEVK